MTYRIELERINKTGFIAYDQKREYAYGAAEVKAMIKDLDIIAKGFKVVTIVKTTKDGKGYDVTNKYIK